MSFEVCFISEWSNYWISAAFVKKKISNKKSLSGQSDEKQNGLEGGA
jgi:hypothetical protein